MVSRCASQVRLPRSSQAGYGAPKVRQTSSWRHAASLPPLHGCGACIKRAAGAAEVASCSKRRGGRQVAALIPEPSAMLGGAVEIWVARRACRCGALMQAGSNEAMPAPYRQGSWRRIA